MEEDKNNSNELNWKRKQREQREIGSVYQMENLYIFNP